MWEWLKARNAITTPAPTREPAAPREDGGRMAGTYRALYQYLEHRYADTVVLSFGQMEDLLGFPLPALARTDLGWWTVPPGPAEPRHSQAWVQARMTATPNLLAQNVIFERRLR